MPLFTCCIHCCTQAGTAPDVISYSCAISSCVECGQWQLALSTLADMQTIAPTVTPNVQTYTAAIRALGKGESTVSTSTR
jgi:pentatricopeptide repeat protein